MAVVLLQWCGHCKALAPKYAEAAIELLENDPPLRIAKVDATAEPSIASRFDIAGYPTLNVRTGRARVQQRLVGTSTHMVACSPRCYRWFQFVCGGRVVKYDGARETADIVSFVKANSFKTAQELTSRADLKALKGIDACVDEWWW